MPYQCESKGRERQKNCINYGNSLCFLFDFFFGGCLFGFGFGLGLFLFALLLAAKMSNLVRIYMCMEQTASMMTASRWVTWKRWRKWRWTHDGRRSLWDPRIQINNTGYDRATGGHLRGLTVCVQPLTELRHDAISAPTVCRAPRRM